MASTSRSSKKKDPFEKKVPVNPKYKNVQSTLDTGASVNKYMKKIEDIRKNYRYRKDEIFKRMKVSTFAQLVLQVARVVNMEMDRLDEDGSVIADDEVTPLPLDSSRGDGSESSRSSMQSVIAGMGEVDISKEDGADPNSIVQEEKVLGVPEATSLPYILLDVRDKDLFDKCHIIGALNYPAAMLSRSCNYFSQEILTFKNKPGKVIIVYDEDERVAPEVATVMVQREVDNVIMLSGGMKVLHKKFPGCFLRGTLPDACFSPPTERKGKPPKALPVITQNKNVDWYTPEILGAMDEFLDEVLLSNETSRMSSRATTSSRTSTAASEKPSSADKWR